MNINPNPYFQMRVSTILTISVANATPSRNRVARQDTNADQVFKKVELERTFIFLPNLCRQSLPNSLQSITKPYDCYIFYDIFVKLLYRIRYHSHLKDLSGLEQSIIYLCRNQSFEWFITFDCVSTCQMTSYKTAVLINLGARKSTKIFVKARFQKWIFHKRMNKTRFFRLAFDF